LILRFRIGEVEYPKFMVDAFTEFGGAAYEVQNTIAVLRTGTAACIRFTCSACIFAA
jgi:hypothetical protein